MKTLTIRECVNYCMNAQREMWERYGKPAEYSKRREVYVRCKEFCKEFCKENGYVGSRFVSIWNTASTQAHKEVVAICR